MEKDRKYLKNTENSFINPLSTISVPCMKTQGGHSSLMPTLMTALLQILCYNNALNESSAK